MSLGGGLWGVLDSASLGQGFEPVLKTNRLCWSLDNVLKTNRFFSFSSSSSKYNLIKTFADHLNRGTELLKTTVHKAIEPLIVKPSKIHRSTSNLSDDGEDSLKSEMCHFKPIRTVPTTPKASL